MSFKSFLSAVGHDTKEVFSWLGSAQGQTTIAAVEGTSLAVTTAVNPVAGATLAGVEALINVGLKEVVSIETVAVAAGQQSGTGAQKLAAVTAAVAPSVGALLQSLGVSNPTSAQTQAVATAIGNGLATILNALPAPVTA